MAKALVKQTTKALASWEEELAQQAEEAAGQEASTGGGQFFSIRAGTLSLNGSPLPGNEMGVVIIDSLLVNSLYEGEYDPDAPQGPCCYAFGRDETTMKPHAEAEKPQNEAGCADCEHNQFGSAAKGRGKACKNGRRLAVIPAGTMVKGEFVPFTEAAQFEKAQVAYLNLPPTSIQGFGAYVKSLAGAMRRPPHGVFTRIAVVPDPKTQVKVVCEQLGPVPDDLIPTMIARNKATRAIIEFPFPKAEAREEKPKKAVKPNRRF